MSTIDSTQSDEEELERQALGRIVHAFMNYGLDAAHEVARWRYNFSRLPATHQSLLPRYESKTGSALAAIHTNSLFLKAMLDTLQSPNAPPTMQQAYQLGVAYGQDRLGGDVGGGAMRPTDPADVEKVRYVFKNLMRDWSEEGRDERASSYGRIVTELQRLVPPSSSSEPLNVLVPGAGLGRLCLDLAQAGYAAQGNEFSYYMLLVSSFMLNYTTCVDQWTLHPFATLTCNHVTDEDQCRGVCVPDVVPEQVLPGAGLMSMCAGDFVECYSSDDMANSFDAIASCFFIDTAHNVIEYLQTMLHCLKPGGYLVNLGPLLYHWADAHTYLPNDDLSIELCLQDVLDIAQKIGFTLERNDMVKNITFNNNVRGMMRQVYE